MDNVDNLNESGLLVMPEDHNSNKKLIRRLCRPKNRFKLRQYLETVISLIINAWVWCLSNFLIVFFNYFAPLMVAIIQILGYYYL